MERRKKNKIDNDQIRLKIGVYVGGKKKKLNPSIKNYRGPSKLFKGLDMGVKKNLKIIWDPCNK